MSDFVACNDTTGNDAMSNKASNDNPDNNMNKNTMITLGTAGQANAKDATKQ